MNDKSIDYCRQALKFAFFLHFTLRAVVIVTCVQSGRNEDQLFSGTHLLPKAKYQKNLKVVEYFGNKINTMSSKKT